MIAARAAIPITASIERAPWEASTPQVISAVSPGSGSPNDSSATRPNRSNSAHWPCWSMKLVIDPVTNGLFYGSRAKAGHTKEAHMDHTDTLAKLYERINAHDLDGFADLMADDFV